MRMLARALRPTLSVVVIVYRMSEQAERTLYSLSPAYQQGVSAGDYEVLVIENDSDQPLGADRAKSQCPGVRYFRRAETLPTPVHAANFGLARARGSHVALMIDGARMLSPGVLRLTLDAFRVSPNGAVAVPGYHLGSKLQQQAVADGYDERQEAALLAGIAWPGDGYRLFDIAVLSGSCRDGYLRPIGESNFLATSRQRWRQTGGMDPRYDSHGGGFANIALYKRLLEVPHTPLYLLFGEGTFHQYHGGATTGGATGERERLEALLDRQDAAIRGADRAAPLARPIFFGAPHPASLRFLRHSLDNSPSD